MSSNNEPKRKVLPYEELLKALEQMFSAVGIEATAQQQEKLFYYIMTTLASYLYDHADYIVRAGYLDIIKKTFREGELFTVQTNNSYKQPNAKTLESYYLCGGKEASELSDYILEYLDGLTEEGEEAQAKAELEILKLNALKDKKTKEEK